jgi:hypothetical protein
MEVMLLKPSPSSSLKGSSPTIRLALYVDRHPLGALICFQVSEKETVGRPANMWSHCVTDLHGLILVYMMMSYFLDQDLLGLLV